MADCSPSQSYDPTNENRISAGALRMRLSRQRRRDGLRYLIVDLRETEVDKLIELGHLRQTDRDDKNAVLLGFYAFLDGSALGGGHR